MPITTYRYKGYEYDIELTPIDPSPYDPSRFEARVTRFTRMREGGGHESLDELVFRIATGRDQEEAIVKVERAVRGWIGP